MRAIGDVYHRAVLNVRARADAYVVTIAAHHRAEPDGRLLADLHVADDNGCLGDVSRRVNLRVSAAKGAYHYAQCLSVI